MTYDDLGESLNKIDFVTDQKKKRRRSFLKIAKMNSRLLELRDVDDFCFFGINLLGCLCFL